MTVDLFYLANFLKTSAFPRKYFYPKEILLSCLDT